ncbi:hypothetical protein GCM10027271_47110 [Saccharopolyspora gloriosae]
MTGTEGLATLRPLWLVLRSLRASWLAGQHSANQLSWRWTFVAVPVLGAVALLAAWRFVPHQPSGSVGVRHELALGIVGVRFRRSLRLLQLHRSSASVAVGFEC